MYILNFCLFLFISKINAARILTIIPSKSIGNHIWFQPVIKELANRGHEITYVSPQPLIDGECTNLFHIDFNDQQETNLPADLFLNKANVFTKLYSQRDDIDMSFEDNLKISEKIIQLVKHHSYDLVIIEWSYPLLAGLSYHFKCPLIGISSQELSLHGYASIGNPIPSILKSSAGLNYHYPMGFGQRLESFLYNSKQLLSYYYITLSTVDRRLRRIFNYDIPSVWHIQKNVNLILTNTHELFIGQQPLLPKVVQIGGIKTFNMLDEPMELDEELKNFLDAADDGVIYINFGVKVPENNDKYHAFCHILTKELNRAGFKTIISYPKHYEEAQNRVISRDYLPQTSILRHHNVKLFINHGGQNSVEESIVGNVPMLIIPSTLEQRFLAKRLVKLGVAKFFVGTKTDELYRTVNVGKLMVNILNNTSFLENTKILSNILLDQPISPLDKAVWSIEHVLRHPKQMGLGSSLGQMSLFVFYMFDVILFVFVIILLITFIGFVIIQKINFQLLFAKIKKQNLLPKQNAKKFF